MKDDSKNADWDRLQSQFWDEWSWITHRLDNPRYDQELLQRKHRYLQHLGNLMLFGTDEQ